MITHYSPRSFLFFMVVYLKKVVNFLSAFQEQKIRCKSKAWIFSVFQFFLLYGNLPYLSNLFFQMYEIQIRSTLLIHSYIILQISREGINIIPKKAMPPICPQKLEKL
ncbi:hypothetical protein CN952_09205 [Bacillus cereus]|nr:hypothetical protein CN952_09205 [Bacillus cereus]PGN14979.1 hypothetical protein CN954_06230 [Bacillus cereus]PHB23314.1 hypothetical protein COE88_14725 [Bacillus toyonensis]